MPYAPWSRNVAGGGMEHCGPWVRGPYVSVQVNVDANGCNIVGDAANEPSIAIDPTNPHIIVIGWRQFDTVASDFRQAGYAYSHDGGTTWTFPGSLAPTFFHSDPVLNANQQGTFYYLSVGGDLESDLFISIDHGVTWTENDEVYGGDKHWMAIDRTGGPGDGNLYTTWSSQAGCCGFNIFSRSRDDGAMFDPPVTMPHTPIWGTVAVGPSGDVFVTGLNFYIDRSTNAQNGPSTPMFPQSVHVDLGGE